MKYLLFSMVALGVVPLAVVLSFSRRWMRWAVLPMVVGFCAPMSTSLNFFSFPYYRGTARGMEINVVHLLSLALLGALALQGRRIRFFPERGSRIYAVFFLLCLPSFGSAADPLLSWLEIWKMLMLALVFAAVYNYLHATDDLETVLEMLGMFVLANAFVTIRQHYSGVYQADGLFDHQNSMGMAMLLLGPIFLTGYLAKGIRGWKGKIRVAVFAGAGISTVMTYSRGSVTFMPVAYGLAGVCWFFLERGRHWFRRAFPVILLGVIGVVDTAPTVVKRFATATEASANTRIELARCALAMMRDEPLRGVGINNWGIKINLPYTYAERSGRLPSNNPDHRDGIVETVYLLVGAECGVPAMLAMMLWFGWHLVACFRLARRLQGQARQWIPLGLLGGQAAIYLQSCLEWVLRQQVVGTMLVICFAVIAHLDVSTRPARRSGSAVPVPVHPEGVPA